MGKVATTVKRDSSPPAASERILVPFNGRQDTSVVAVVWTERQQYITQSHHFDEPIVTFNDRNHSAMASTHCNHNGLTPSVFVAVTKPVDRTPCIRMTSSLWPVRSTVPHSESTRDNVTGDLEGKGGGKKPTRPPVAGAWDADYRYVVVVPGRPARACRTTGYSI